MEQKEKKVYLANFKPIGNTSGLKGRIYFKDEQVQLDPKGRKYIPMAIWQNREPDQYGNTHVGILDTFKPNKEAVNENSNTNNLPF